MQYFYEWCFSLFRDGLSETTLLKIHERNFLNGLTYEAAGVSISRGNQFVTKIKSICCDTSRVGADAKIGGFGGCFDLKAAGYGDPILVSGTDGVGTKLRVRT